MKMAWRKHETEWTVSYNFSSELTEGLEKEKETRIKNEKENMGKINESLFLLKENLKEEKDERNLKLRELQKSTEA